mgnify:FL=1
MRKKRCAAVVLAAVLSALSQFSAEASTVTKVRATVCETESAGNADAVGGTLEQGAAKEINAASTVAQEVATDGVVQNEPPTRIYVSKEKRKLSLYVDNQLVGAWECNIGTNSANGKKQVEGDRVTPEGEYYICLRNNRSNYHLSLGLSYPDKSDADRGIAQGLISQAEQDAIYRAIDQKACPPWKTALGGYVMIHGNYTEGFSTAGCVAVRDAVMDVLWAHVPLGTKVTIGR